MIRALCLVGGLAGAAGLSQFPEFSQQYMQRLGGQVDELTRIAKEFDASALAEGLGREEALEQLGGEGFADRHQADLRAMFARQARLAENLAVLQNASSLERMMMPQRMMDRATVAAAWQDFTPAVPFSTAGVAAAGTGFVGGWAAILALLGVVLMPFRGRRNHSARRDPRPTPNVKTDPPVTRPQQAPQTQSHIRPLAGAKR